jgi:hypothetical protein
MPVPAALYHVIVPVAHVPLNVAVSPKQIGVLTATFVGVFGFGFTVNVTDALASLEQFNEIHFAV